MHGNPLPPACCYWLTGLPGAGKSTLANKVAQTLRKKGIAAFVLDGDQLRRGLNSDLAYSPSDRAENVRRIGEVARLMVDAGIVVLVAAISPYQADRQAVRGKFAEGRFFEVFVDADLQTCMARDPKGLYRMAQAGEIANLTGFNAPYERPLSPALHLHTGGQALGRCVEALLEHHENLQVPLKIHAHLSKA